MSSPHLVLLGGGHAMLPSLLHACTWTSAGIDVTLVDPNRYLYYSGMVPEYLGGVYDEEEVRIDLARRAADAEADAVLWATGTVGPALLRNSPLPTDDRGFLRATRSLQSVSHPRIFAAGDCAAINGLDLAKVGVHAVKQGPTLRTNLGRTLRALADGRPVPQPKDLATFQPYPLTPLILSTGSPDGLWTAGPLWAAHPWLLRLKHWIDRRWIRPYAPEHWKHSSWRDLLGAESALHTEGAR